MRHLARPGIAALLLLFLAEAALANCASDCAPVTDLKELPARLAKCQACKALIGLSSTATASPFGNGYVAAGCQDVGSCVFTYCPQTLDCFTRCQERLNECHGAQAQAELETRELVSEYLSLVAAPEPMAPPPPPAPAPPAPPAPAPPAPPSKSGGLTASFCPGPQNPNPPYNCL